MEYNYMHISELTPQLAVKRSLWGAKAPPFLFIKIEGWNLVCINGILRYAFMWVNSSMGHEATLVGCERPIPPPTPLLPFNFTPFFIYQHRRLKFGGHIFHEKFNTMICIRVGQFTSVQLILPPLHPSSPMVKSKVAPSFWMGFRVGNMKPIDIFQKSKIAISIFAHQKNCLNLAVFFSDEFAI